MLTAAWRSCGSRPAALPPGRAQPSPAQAHRLRSAARAPGRPHRPPRSRRGRGTNSQCAAASSRLCRDFLSGPCGRFRSAKPAMLCAAAGRAAAGRGTRHRPPAARGSLGLVVACSAEQAGPRARQGRGSARRYSPAAFTKPQRQRQRVSHIMAGTLRSEECHQRAAMTQGKACVVNFSDLRRGSEGAQSWL